ncbi:thioredoxin-like protein HCF164, chloroplastic isoform X2 [Miscanthus floridulus]|uniref:thioredoxin-like protein HCF164, chloroplastic isoform X2 n=1 Tax=Miscanthus floridulus TaxID=154761 RepID=UPI0034585F6A
MGAAGKPPPLVCFKWPWSPNPNPSPSPSPSPSPCGDLELPWLFKSIRTLSQDLLIAGDLPSPASSAGGGLWGRQRRTGAAVVEADRGDAEQRALAAALASGSPATVLEFYSPRCRLCASLRDLVRELEDGASGSASFVLADAEDDRWLPELLHYDVRYVPCFVLLDKHGRALAKTGVPTSRQHVIAGLHHLLKMQQPSGLEGNQSAPPS